MVQRLLLSSCEGRYQRLFCNLSIPSSYYDVWIYNVLFSFWLSTVDLYNHMSLFSIVYALREMLQWFPWKYTFFVNIDVSTLQMVIRGGGFHIWQFSSAASSSSLLISFQSCCCLFSFLFCVCFIHSDPLVNPFFHSITFSRTSRHLQWWLFHLQL